MGWLGVIAVPGASPRGLGYCPSIPGVRSVTVAVAW